MFGTNQCGQFGSAYLKSRSSDSFTAAVKDFVPPTPVSISNCPATLTTNATDSVTVGGSISDTATLDVPANTNGSITFRLYGPFTNASDITSTSCTSAKLVSAATSTKTVTNFNPTSPDYTSSSYTTGAAGYYNWTAQFTSTTTGVNSTGEVGCGDTTEQSQVNKKQPTISTSATTPVTLGASIKDTATLTGATDNASGGITFKLYGPFDASTTASGDTCVDSGTGANLVTTLGPNAIGSPNGSGNYVVSSGNYTPTAVGRYQWVASYASGDNNSNASSACRDANEASVVGKAPSSVSTAQSYRPQDSATITGAGTLGGNVTFKLYRSLADCQADTGSVYGPDTASVNGTGSVTVSTNNTTYTIEDGAKEGDYYWGVAYSGDNTHNGVRSCVENSSVTITNGGTVNSN